MAITAAVAVPWVLEGIKALGSFLSARGGDKTNRLALQQQQQQWLMDFLNNMVNRKEDVQMERAGTGLAATQMNPYAHAQYLNRSNVRRSFAEGLGPGGSFQGGFDMSALSPDSLQRTGDYFYKNVAEAQPNVPLGDVSPGAETFRQTRGPEIASQSAEQQRMIDNFLQGAVPCPPGLTKDRDGKCKSGAEFRTQGRR